VIFSRLILFALYIVFVAAGTMWRFADAWEGFSYGRRASLALCASCKWWPLFCAGLLVFAAAAHAGRGVSGDIALLIAIVIALGFAVRFSAKMRGSEPDQYK